MNKLVLSSGRYKIDRYSDAEKITVKGECVLDIIGRNESFKLDIDIEKDASLTIYMFDIIDDVKIELNVTSDDNSKFNLNSSFINHGNFELLIDTNIYGDNITNTVNVKGLNEEDGIVRIVLNGCVAGNTKGNVVNEYARLINKSDQANILVPNLIVNTCDVLANHGVSIGSINSEEISYLMSKGIEKSSAIKILEEGFIKSHMDEESKEKIKNILLGR